MATETVREKFFDAFDAGYEALLSAAEATEARGHRASRLALEEARKGEKELVELARKWTGAPTAFFDTFATMVELQAHAERRALELARDALTGAREYRGDVRKAVRGMLKANRAAAGAIGNAFGNALGRLRSPGGEAEVARGQPAGVHRVPVAAMSAAKTG